VKIINDRPGLHMAVHCMAQA